jgi:hypothetical protein
VFEGPFNFDLTSLVNGTNWLAAEVHQRGSSSSDIVMGLTLDAVWQTRVRDTAAPVVARTLPTAGSTVFSLSQVQVFGFGLFALF